MAEHTNNTLVTENLGLVHSCANRFRGSGVEYDDLFQAGCVGLIKAAAGFDPSLGFRFSTYAVPAILGEIKRIFRDGGAVKIGRSAKEKARNLFALKEELSLSLGREPTVTEIADKAQLDVSETASLLCACMPVISLTSDEDEGQTDIPVDSEEERLSDHIDLMNSLDALDETERLLIEYRYFKGLTQTVTAKKMGLSQVQVSRKEKAILLKLRKMLS
ncbi:MAG: sigma-70 family RNA polymerase sigma factor [Clostridia bacterium]|nr:sigma-70 family RNA polymerase sigma factor [Clostridia bacterium]